MQITPSKLAQAPVVVYGAGGIGHQTCQVLKEAGILVRFVMDRKKHGATCAGRPVVAPDQLPADFEPGTSICVLGLHNPYVNISALQAELRGRGFTTILTFPEFSYLFPDVRIQTFWLDNSFDFEAHQSLFDDVYARLADEQSRDVMRAIWKFRRTGDYGACPVPTIDDQYKPRGLRRYASPLRFIDCGAYDGDSIQSLLDDGYRFEEVAAFEPDLENFAKLVHRFKDFRVTALPLGVWSHAVRLSFQLDANTSSKIDDSGGVSVICVGLDDALSGFAPNLLKFDIEGAEMEALHGARSTIMKHRPAMCISTYHTPDHMLRIPEFVASLDLGYRMYLRSHAYSSFETVLYCFPEEA